MGVQLYVCVYMHVCVGSTETAYVERNVQMSLQR